MESRGPHRIDFRPRLNKVKDRLIDRQVRHPEAHTPRHDVRSMCRSFRWGVEVAEVGTGCRGPRRGVIEHRFVPKGFELRFFMGASQAKVSSQESQAQDSRDEILKAAIHLFATRGFHETSMSEVAREAKVSKALIFWHFKTKEELFLAVLNKLLEPYVIDFAEESEKLDPREQIKKLIGGYVNFVRENASSVSF